MSISFRDPAGKLFLFEEEVFRAINKTGIEDFTNSLNSGVLRNFVESNRLVKVFELEDSESLTIREFYKEQFQENSISQVVKHEKIPFPSYPYEWAPEMLHSAALLTLDLAEKLLEEGMGLKDATPFNILFRGANAVFVDWLSFEKRDPRNPIWLSQAQFIRTFSLPLLANKHFGLELNRIFTNDRDGMEPENIYKMCSLRQKLMPGFLSFVTIPKLLSSKSQKNPSIYEDQLLDDAEKSTFILNRQFDQLRRTTQKVIPATGASSDWAEYVGDKQHFSDEYFQQKQEFISKFFEENKSQTVLDVGCNTGIFSRIAAESGASVVAIDQDPTVVGKVWRMAKTESLDILPLVVDIARPSPAIGWRNRENLSFLERVKGKMDVVMMLAVVHHLMVTERIPLEEILELMAEITKDFLIIEFIPKDDPMFKQISRGRDALFDGFDEDFFRSTCQKRFQIVRNEKLADSNRQLYLLKNEK